MVKQHPKFNNHAHNVLNINQLMFKMAVIDFFYFSNILSSEDTAQDNSFASRKVRIFLLFKHIFNI